MPCRDFEVVLTGADPGAVSLVQVSPLEDIVDTADIFVTTTGNKDIIMASDMAKMKNNAIVGNIGHFDNEIDMAGLLGWPGIKRQNIKPQARAGPGR
jgi:adenosylhomocysteinase